MNEKELSARKASLYVLGRCRRFDAWTKDTLDSACHKFSLDTRDRALCSRICLSFLQNSILTDYYINCFSSVNSEKLAPQVRDIIRIGIVQILFLDRVPDSAAVNTSVELAKGSCRQAAGLVNAVLRRIVENKNMLPEINTGSRLKDLSIQYSHPYELCQILLDECGFNSAAAFLAKNNEIPVLTVSVNLCRISREDFILLLTSAGIYASANKISPLSVDLTYQGAIEALPGFNEGFFFVQDAAAAFAASAAPVYEGMNILDACAAPGGKSMALASLIKNAGHIISCDIHEKKLQRIDENAARLGFSCISTLPMDASKPYDQFMNSFDLVIADVPCSGLGVIRKKPEIRFKNISEIKKLPEVQLRILRQLCHCVRPGGTLIYSTCTILSAENHDVIAAFLSENSLYSLEFEKTFWPHQDGTDGFYVCRLRRNEND